MYRTIEQLVRSGMVVQSDRSREGRFPERTVYCITERGRGELEEWLREMLCSVHAEGPPPVPGAADVPAHADAAGRAGAAREARRPPGDGRSPPRRPRTRARSRICRGCFFLEEEYSCALRHAELEHVRSLIADLGSGRLAWDQDELWCHA